MTKQIEAPRIKIQSEVLPKQKGPHGEKMTLFQGKGAAPALEVITLTQSLRTDRTIYGNHSIPPRCPDNSNRSCPDASCPPSSCRVQNTDNNAHTCAISCSICR